MAIKQTTNWCFTLNNYDKEVDVPNIAKWPARYTIYGREKGENGTPHLQGFTVLEKKTRLAGVKKLHNKAHWEAAKGSWEQAANYCKKDGDYTEIGEAPMTKKKKATVCGEAEKGRWEDAWENAKKGNFDDVPADIKFRYYRTMKEVAKDHMVKPDDENDVTGVWIYGPPGCGKSRKAREEYPGAYDKMQNKWWDGYQGEEYVILDDFDSKELGHHLKIWADRYSFLAETKGGAINIRPKKFIITSNYAPDDFGWDNEMVEAIKRRFKIIHMNTHLGGIDMRKRKLEDPLSYM